MFYYDYCTSVEISSDYRCMMSLKGLNWCAKILWRKISNEWSLDRVEGRRESFQAIAEPEVGMK